MNCIICGGKIISQCKCLRGDAICENGHSYHWSPFYKEYHQGLSDHSTDTFNKDCCKDKRKIEIINK